MVRHPLGELDSGHGLETRVILDELGVEDLAAGVLALEQYGAHVGASGVESGGQTRGTTADDDEVVIGQEGSFLEELPQTRTAEHSIGIPTTERWLALGDSFTIGTGTTPDRSFPAVLTRLWSERGRNVELRNPAVNGYRTDDLIAEELPLVAPFQPTLVTILIGANDIVAGSADDRYRERLRVIHLRVRADAPAAAVYALPQPDWSLSRAGTSFGDAATIAACIDRFNAIAREEAERAGAAYVDIAPLMREQMRRGMFAPDGLHPSTAAYAEWAEALRDRLVAKPPAS
jgi:lysophospholipase L1-like esterase